jgi:c-di-GMP-binding flagellar brake protein YcgR
MTNFAERRRFGRIRVSLAVRYRLDRPEAGRGRMMQGQGVLRDISLSGSYFQVEPAAALALGQVLDLSIAAAFSGQDFEDTSCIRARGQVVRLERPGPAQDVCGVAVNFLEGLHFLSQSATEH